MNKVNYSYNRNSNLYKYDNTISNKLLFSNEIELGNKNYILSKQCRYILEIDNFDKVIYIPNIDKENTTDGIVLKSFNKSVLLIPIGENIFLLSFHNATIHELSSILFTFMLDTQCVIDITKYKFLFKDCCNIIPMFKKLCDK